MRILQKHTVRSSITAIAVWSLQLVFPTLVVIAVLNTPGGRRAPGVYTATVLGLAAFWFIGCCLAVGAAGMRRWILTHRAQLITLYVSTTLGLVVMEMYFRYKTAKSWKQLRGKLPETEYSPELGWKLARGSAGVGEHGWRGPYRSSAKPKGCFRIVCLGDSTTHGFQCSWDEAWPHQLETLLNADACWRSAHGATEAVNLGVPAFGTDQELLALKKDGLSYHPDVVILHMCVNDFADVSYDHDWRMFANVTRYKPFFTLDKGRLLLRRDFAPLPRHQSGRVYRAGDGPSFGLHSAFLHEVGRFLVESDRGAGVEDRWPTRDDFQVEYAQSRPLVWALVREMAALARGAGSRFLVTLSPTHLIGRRDSSPSRVAKFLREYESDAAAAGVSAIHFNAEFSGEEGIRGFISDRSHLNARGNALVARRIMRWLKDHDPLQR